MDENTGKRNQSERDALLANIIQLKSRGLSFRKMAPILGRDESVVRRAYKRWLREQAGDITTPETAQPQDELAVAESREASPLLGDKLSDTVSDSTRDVSSVSTRIRSLEDLLAALHVDTSIWRVKTYTCNSWNTLRRNETKQLKFTDGKIDGTIEDYPTQVETVFQVKAQLERISTFELASAEMCAALLEDIRATTQLDYPRIAYRGLETPHLLQIAPADAHFGKLCWAEETGENADLKLVEETFRYGIEELIEKASGFHIAQIVFVMGNDMMHMDNLANTTTGGTPQDADSRYFKVFRRARAAHSWAIQRLREIAPVHTIVTPGNHDRQSAFCLGEVLEAEFHTAPHLSFNNSPKLRKYYDYGVNLLGYTHGSEEKIVDLPLIMATEEAERWARCPFRQWFIGHRHRAKETRFLTLDSARGVRVRELSSLTALDAWHFSRGLGDRRASEAFVFSPKTGPAGEFHVTLLPNSDDTTEQVAA